MPVPTPTTEMATKYKITLAARGRKMSEAVIMPRPVMTKSRIRDFSFNNEAGGKEVALIKGPG